MKSLFLLISNLLLFLMLFFSFEGISQTNTMMGSLNASGNLATGNSGSISYSIGQVFYTYFGETVYNVAQGIQHADTSQETEEASNTPEEVDTSEDVDTMPDTPKTDLLIYPNPAKHFITITAKGVAFQNQINSYQLFNYQGQLLMQNSISQVNTKINLKNLSTSIYILHVFVNEKLYKTFKILKK